MDIDKFIQNWLAIANAYDTQKFVNQWHQNAILNDPSVGQVFKGHQGIKTYFEEYFIGYSTQTKLVKLEVISNNKANIKVEFSGTFPGNKIGGTFEFIFKDGKIEKAKADLL